MRSTLFVILLLVVCRRWFVRAAKFPPYIDGTLVVACNFSLTLFEGRDPGKKKKKKKQ